MKNSEINLLILGALNFPHGSAPTARIHEYSKCIVENKGKVTILCLKAHLRKESGTESLQPEGTIDGIKYIYTPGTIIRSDSFLERRFLALKGVLNALKLIRRLNKQNKISAFLFFSTTALHETLFTFYARLLDVPVIREKNEYPFPDRSTFWKKKIANLHGKYINKLFDGIIVITRYLEDYYKPLIRKDSKSLFVPIVVDVSRFEGHLPSSSSHRYIAYCGKPSGTKDGVPILIEAFSIVSKKYKDIKLYIIGNAGRYNDMQKLKNKVKSLNIENKVIFTGLVSPTKIPEYLCNATVLALARPSNLQAKGGFPTKLGEYLATGRPVVVTKVGELNNYLKDGESVFFSEPNNVKVFAEKLDFVLSNPEVARKVGQKGKNIALKNFNYKSHSQRIINFIKALNKK